MPLYEYQCQDCGHGSEELQKFADAPLTVCPACGGRYKRLISAPAFQFKGSGWYVTDYARSGSAKGSSDKEAPTSPAASGEKTSQEPAKPAEKGEAKASAPTGD